MQCPARRRWRLLPQGRKKPSGTPHAASHARLCRFCLHSRCSETSISIIIIITLLTDSGHGLFPYVSPLNLYLHAVGTVLEAQVEELGLRVPAGMDGGVGVDTLRFVWHV